MTEKQEAKERLTGFIVKRLWYTTYYDKDGVPQQGKADHEIGSTIKGGDVTLPAKVAKRGSDGKPLTDGERLQVFLTELVMIGCLQPVYTPVKERAPKVEVIEAPLPLTEAFPEPFLPPLDAPE